jgi:hypothetical protein
MSGCDRISILNSRRMLFVIRGVQKGKLKQEFEDSKAIMLVEERFVHGIMYGNAFKDTNITRMLETLLLI